MRSKLRSPLLCPFMALSMAMLPTRPLLAAQPAPLAPPPEDAVSQPEEEPPSSIEVTTSAPESAGSSTDATVPEPTSPPTPAVEPTPDVASPATDRPPEPRIGNRPRTGKGLLIAGGVVLGAGIASTITFVAMTRGCKFSGPLQCRLRSQDDLLIPLGVSMSLLGVMLLAVGGGYYVAYRKWERWTPEQSGKDAKRRRRNRNARASILVAPGIMQGGASLGAVGRF